MSVNAPILEQTAADQSSQESLPGKKAKRPSISIVPRHLFTKSGLSQRQEQEVPSELNEKVVNEVLARVAGTITHAAFARMQKRLTLGQEIELVDLEVNKEKNSDRLQEWKIDSDLREPYYQDSTLKDLFNKSLPIFGNSISPSLREKAKKNWNAITERLAALTSASFEHVPMLNNPNAVFVPEARLYPETKYAKFVLVKINRPGSRVTLPGGKRVNKLFNSINFKNDLGFGEIDQQEFYYQIFAGRKVEEDPEDNHFGHDYGYSNSSFLFSEHFQSFLDEHNFFTFGSTERLVAFLMSETNANVFAYAKENSFSVEEIKQFFAIRILLKARKEFDYFMGGRSAVNTKEELKEVINTFEFWDEVDGSKYSDLVDKIPIESKHIFSPVNIRTDILSFHFPEGDLSSEQEMILAELRAHLKEVYDQGVEQHCVYEDFAFLKLLDKAIKLGMKISLGDLKVISQTDEVKEFRRRKKHAKELQFYMTIMAESVVAFRKQEHPDQDFTIFDLMKDPLIQAFDESFILYLKLNLNAKPVITKDIHYREPFKDKVTLREIHQKVVKPMNRAMQVVPRVKIKKDCREKRVKETIPA